ncbi:MAG: glycoside hydrolase family 13 protein [Candidatus Bipolaricaulota bacterium]
MTKPPSWVQDAVFYQVFPDRFRNGDPSSDPPDVHPWGARPDNSSCFGGDIKGIVQGLDHIQSLGASALYLTPVFHARSNHKYDTTDYYTVDPQFSDEHTLRDLVREAHARGMRIVLDGVFNHCGLEHPFFQDVVAKGRASPYWDWFKVSGDQVVQKPEPNYVCWGGVPAMPEWNHANSEVTSYLLNVVRYWIRSCDIDGWRLDTVEYLPPDFVLRVRQAAKEEKPEAFVLGEVMGTAASWFKHKAIDGTMHYRLWEALVGFAAQGTLDGAAFAGFVRFMWGSYPPRNGRACYTLLGSHDKARFLTLSGGDARRLQLGAALLFTLPGAPAVYYGDEVGLEGGDDPDCRRCFPWDTGQWDQDTLELFRRLIALRHKAPVLRRGSLTVGECTGKVASLVRRMDGQTAAIVANGGTTDVRAPSPGPGLWRDALEGDRINGGKLSLPRFGFKILLQGADTA